MLHQGLELFFGGTHSGSCSLVALWEGHLHSVMMPHSCVSTIVGSIFRVAISFETHEELQDALCIPSGTEVGRDMTHKTEALNP